MKPQIHLTTKDTSLIAVIAALCVATNYAMFGLWNIKLMDLLVFVSGFCFGGLVGSLVGIFTWGVYGTLNPLGFSLPIWVATCLSESLYGVGGGLARKFGLKVPNIANIGREEHWICSAKIALLGFLLTFTYDFLTNLVCVIWAPPLAVFVGAVPFAAAHIGSNLFFFFVGGVTLIMAIQKLSLKRGDTNE